MRAVHAALGLVARQLDAASNPLRRSVASRSSADKAKMSFSRGAARRVSTRASLSPETAENVVMQISGVIKFGAPMYNKGDARGCARLYRQTALSIARDASVTSEEIRSCLRDAVAKADEIARKAAEEDPMGGEEDQQTQERVAGRSDAASTASLTSSWTRPWTNRPSTARRRKRRHSRRETTTPRRRRSRDAANAHGRRRDATLFDFAKTPDLAGRWRSLNDGVMGASATGGCGGGCGGPRRVRGDGPAGEQRRVLVRSRLVRVQDKPVAVPGVLHGRQARGQASAEEEVPARHKDDECMTTQVNFKAKFGTRKKGGWERVKVPFAAFDRPERMGRAVMRGALRTEAVCEVGLMVLKGEGNVGAFALDVLELGCFK